MGSMWATASLREESCGARLGFLAAAYWSISKKKRNKRQLACNGLEQNSLGEHCANFFRHPNA